MALILKDRVQETTTTTGTGTLTLGGAVTGYQSFSAIGNANTTYYAIYASGGSEWEVGIGTYTASGTTLSRDTVLSSSNSGSLVSFSAGTKNVWCDYPAGRAGYIDTNSTLNAPVLATSGYTSTTPVLSFNGSNTDLALGATVSGSYLQTIMQNKSGTAGASTNYVLSNDLGTDSTYYGEFGMNSSVFSSGTPADFFSLNNGIYYSGHDGDITVGSGNGKKTFLAWGTAGQSAHVINATGSIGLNTNITGTTNFGTSGQVLTSAGSAATPTWTTPTTGTVTSVAATAGTGISVSGSPITSSGTLTITNTAPDQTVAITGAGGAVVTGTYPNFTITTPSGTVTSVTATAPITSSGGATPNLAMPAATTSVNGYLTSTDWTTFNGKQAALVSGTNIKTVSGTSLLGSGDLGLIGATYGGTGVNNGSNTITVAGNLTHSGAFTQSFTASANTAVTLPAGATAASNNLLSSATPVGIVTGTPSSTTYLRGDGTWSTVAASPAGSTTQVQYNNAGAFGASSSFTYASSTLTAPNLSASNGLVVNNATVGASFSIASGYNAMSVGPVTVASGQSVTVPSGSRWVVL